MVKAEFCYFSRGTDLQKLTTAKRTNRFLADNQIWEAQGPWFSEIYVCKSPQGGGKGGSTGPAAYYKVSTKKSLELLQPGNLSYYSR